jgi:hypothetical protein
MSPAVVPGSAGLIGDGPGAVGGRPGHIASAEIGSAVCAGEQIAEHS